MFEKASKIIHQKKQNSIKKQAQAAWICFESQEIISNIIPQRVAEIDVVSWANNKLIIASGSNYLSQEIRMHIPQIKLLINKKLNQDVVKEIIIRTR